MLIAYANKIGRANTSYIESTVRNWADSNILSIAAAEEKLRGARRNRHRMEAL